LNFATPERVLNIFQFVTIENEIENVLVTLCKICWQCRWAAPERSIAINLLTAAMFNLLSDSTSFRSQAIRSVTITTLERWQNHLHSLST
jgi:tRNA G26 N,N-dimethylase Trm1